MLDEVVGEDGQSLDIAMANEFAAGLGRLRVVEEGIAIHAFAFAVLEHGVPDDVGGLIAQVFPHERDGLAVLICERRVSNGTTVGADQIVLGGVTAEVMLHLDLLLGSAPAVSVRRG